MADDVLDSESEMVPVKVIVTNGQATLVEWNDGKALQRATIPADAVSVPKSATEQPVVSSDVLTMGIPYGVPWADVLKPVLDPVEWKNRLHDAGIWTAKDVVEHAKELYGIVQAFYGIDVGAIIMAANTYEEVKHG